MNLQKLIGNQNHLSEEFITKTIPWLISSEKSEKIIYKINNLMDYELEKFIICLFIDRIIEDCELGSYFIPLLNDIKKQPYESKVQLQMSFKLFPDRLRLIKMKEKYNETQLYDDILEYALTG